MKIDLKYEDEPEEVQSSSRSDIRALLHRDHHNPVPHLGRHAAGHYTIPLLPGHMCSIRHDQTVVVVHNAHGRPPRLAHAHHPVFHKWSVHYDKNVDILLRMVMWDLLEVLPGFGGYQLASLC